MTYLLSYTRWKKLHEVANGEIPQDGLDPIPVLPGESGRHSLNPIAAEAYAQMVAAAKADGVEWGITDSYRPLEVQVRLAKEKGLYSQGGLAAAPGTSNHGWGSAVDLNFKIGKGDQFQWLKDNAARFGFTNIPREPWHWEHKESAQQVKGGTLPANTNSPKTSVTTTNSVQNLLSGKLLLKSGAKGEAVKEVQLKLKEKGFLTKEPNSEYDADTFNAVKEFQTKNKDLQGNSLKADGIVGPKTASALFDQQPSQVVSSGKVSSVVQEVSPQITDYDTIVATVIDKLEGGYYHPDMLKDGRVKDSRYGASGETMMGIDRVAGGKLNDTQPGKEFWKMIDDAGASSKWKWNYRGGELEPKLRQLAGEIIKPQFEKLANTYLSEEARKIVFSDGRLLFHFVYATWNGSGWFKKFGKDVSDAVGSGVTNPDELLRIAIASRTEEGLNPGSSPNSLIAQGGKKIEKIVGLA